MGKWYRQNFWVTHMRTCTCTGVAAYPASICYDTRPEATRHTVEPAQTQKTQVSTKKRVIMLY